MNEIPNIQASREVGSVTGGFVAPIVVSPFSTAPLRSFQTRPSILNRFFVRKQFLTEEDGWEDLGFKEEEPEVLSSTIYRDWHKDGSCKRYAIFNTSYNSTTDVYVIDSILDSKPTTTNRNLEELIVNYILDIGREEILKQTASLLFRVSFYMLYEFQQKKESKQGKRLKISASKEPSDTAYRIWFKKL